MQEKDAFIRGTRENNSFCFYAEQTRGAIQYCVIEVNSLDGDTVRVNLYGFDYKTYYEHVKTTAVQAGSVILQYEHGKRTIPLTQHFGTYPDYELGDFVSYKFILKPVE